METQETKNKNGQGFGIVALICGIVSLFISFVPCVGILAIPISITAIVFGIVSMVRARKSENPAGMATAGVITAGIAFIVSIAWLVVVVDAGHRSIYNTKWNPNFNMFFDLDGVSCDFESVDFENRDTTLERLATVLNDMNGDKVCVSANDSVITVTVEDGDSKVTIGAKKKQNTVVCKDESSDSE